MGTIPKLPVAMAQRRSLAGVFDNAAFMWVIIAVSIVVGVALLAFLIWAIVTRCGRGKSSAVAPEKNPDVEKALAAGGLGGTDAEKKAAAEYTPLAAPQEPPGPHPPPMASGYTPPPAGTQALLPSAQQLPPGIMLAPVVPPFYNPLFSNPRLATDPPYERMALISSRVANADQVAHAVLPNVAYVVYDWKNYTLQELLRYIKKVLGAQKVVSIAVIAPGNKPGQVSLLEGAGTAPDKLLTKTELSQFWRVLAGCVALSGTADGRRIDLLGCRVCEAPREGAQLLKELWNLTTVPFAAADDALGGFMLSTFMEEPVTKQLSLISSTIPAIDLYFNRFALLGIPPPAGMALATGPPPPPLPPGTPPPGSIVPIGMTPPLPVTPPAAAAAGAAAAGATVAGAAAAIALQQQQQQQQALQGQMLQMQQQLAPVQANAAAASGAAVAGPTDIFTRLSRALQAAGKSPDAAFIEFDVNSDLVLTTEELTKLMQKYVPDASPMDIKHFQAMLDTETEDGRLSRSEFAHGLPENVAIQEKVRTGNDEDEVVLRLQEYLTDNEQLMRSTYEDFDANANGLLDHKEMQQLIACIPGLDPHEKKFILAYLYHYDQDKDQRVSFDELKKALDHFGKPPPTIAHHVAASGGAVTASAGGAAAAASAQAYTAAAAMQAQGQGAMAGMQAQAQGAMAGMPPAPPSLAALGAPPSLAPLGGQPGLAPLGAPPSLAPLGGQPGLAPLGAPPSLAPLGGQPPLAPLGAPGLAPLGGPSSFAPLPGLGPPRPGGLAPLAPLPGQ
ncbi:hypothetical protein HYH03_018292 [Edaphochlamys debaryana]|uniref:EF-hand domain-containing protein n=1 Tax=Edaphochlamys debaryana TaxID=47281 RepID=A0A836BNF5_9CHLO|nr:hypothetical protein HYH03_018292 [Edaphochlamys debaryana]|eukprot:KAG2482802.1 hypothetical protein HYH03_018292 [Edaphochlamys debaryana]